MEPFRFFFCVFIVLMVSCKQPSDRVLPIYNPANLNAKLVDKTLQNKTENHKVLDFELIDQNGETITQKDLIIKFT